MSRGGGRYGKLAGDEEGDDGEEGYESDTGKEDDERITFAEVGIPL